MSTVSEILARAKPRTREVRVNLDGELLGRIDDLSDLISAARRRDMLAGGGLTAEAPALEVERAQAEQTAAETTTVFSLKAVPGQIFDDLKRRYPPTEDQWKAYREEAAASPIFARAPEFDYDQVIPRLIGLSVTAVDGTEVAWSEDDGLALWNGLSDGARADLGNGAWQVNNKSSIRPTSGTGTDTTPNSGPESTTPADGASPTPSSVDGS